MSASPLIELNRPSGKVVGSWISDMVELRKAICLCWSCRHKFNERTYFRATGEKRRHPHVFGQCDGCKNHSRTVLFMPEELMGVSWEKP